MGRLVNGVRKIDHPRPRLDRLFLPHPCRNGSDSEAICRRTHKARTLLVMETMEDPEESDSHKCDYVCTGWSIGRLAVEMERTVGCSWIEFID